MIGLLESGSLIVSRLKAACALSPDNVFSTSDLAGVKESSQVTPARHVVLHSYAPTESVGSDRTWSEIWLVVHVVKNVRQGAGAQVVSDSAAAMLAETLAVLDGWLPAGAVRPLRSIEPPRPLISSGYGYFALAFAVEVGSEGYTRPDL